MRLLPGLLTSLFCALVLSGPALADGCTFDADAHQRVVAQVAGRHSGSHPSKDGGLTWDFPGGASESFGYGGCNDLGSVASRTEKSPRPLSIDEILQSARALAAKYWVISLLHTNAAALLSQALDQQAYEATNLPDGGLRIQLHPAHSTLAELYVSYTYEHGQGTVEIGYQDGR